MKADKFHNRSMREHHRVSVPAANRLWIARKRAGLPQKWVATLLGHRSLSKVSEYECGRKLPGLRTALKLELIYQTPLAELFPGLHSELLHEIASAKERHPVLKQRGTEHRRDLA